MVTGEFGMGFQKLPELLLELDLLAEATLSRGGDEYSAGR
jgi:hypothetical protein